MTIFTKVCMGTDKMGVNGRKIINWEVYRMRLKRFKNLKKGFALFAAALMLGTAMPTAGMGMLTAKAEDASITESSVDYDFTKIASGFKISEGDMIADTGVYYAKYVSSGVTFDGTLRFRKGNVLYFPLKDDTSKVEFSMLCNGDKPDRLVILGEDVTDTTYSVAMATKAGDTTSVVVPDITDYIKVISGKKYLPLISNGDVKAKNITIKEYNPINTVTVSGTVQNAAFNGVKQIKFKNLDNASADTVIVSVDAQGNYEAQLRRVDGNTNYVASISNAGFKIDDTADANLFTLTGNGSSVTQNFNVTTAPVAELSGKLTGINESLTKGDVTMKLVPSDTVYDDVSVSLTKSGDDYTFAGIKIVPDIEYNVSLTNCDDYEVTAVVKKEEGIYANEVITAAEKAKQTVSGSFVTSDEKSAAVTKITFTNMETPAYIYTFDVTGNTYSASLRSGEYETTAVVAGYTAYDHVSVKDAAVENDVYLSAPADMSAVAYKDTVKVGEGEEFETISDAVAYITRMTRNEDERVTIQLTDASYREQLVINTPNITVTSTRTKGSTITWYYGVGYSYYSAKKSEDGKSAYYDEGCAVDKYYKVGIEQNPGHWGATVNLLQQATGFRAENITFENSLNRYMTAEEVVDGVGKCITGNAKLDRSTATSADVLKYTSKERGATIYIQADDTEYKDCEFLSSQDTIYTGDNTENSYFTNCLIEGTTDYICGDGNPVFDDCTLSMYGYSDQEAVASYIVASKGTGAHGYLFNNCNIVTTDFPGLMGTSGNILARAWGAGTVVFNNTEVEKADMIAADAYRDMNAKVTEAHYYEYNTHTPDGAAVDISARAQGVTIITKEDADKISTESYFDGWTPLYYAMQVDADYTKLKAALSKAGAIKDATIYIDFSAVMNAANQAQAALGKYTLAEQDRVDAFTEELEAALNALVLKDADYTAVTKAVAAAEALTAADYKDFSAVETAVKAVVKDLKIDEQAKVDAMAKAITDAIAALEKKAPAVEDKPEETFEKVEASGDAVEEIADTTISKDAVIKNEAGETVSIEDVKVEIKKPSEEKIAEVKEIVKKNEITVTENAVTKFYEIDLSDKNGSVVKLDNGKVKITLAEDTSVDLSKVDAIVYHIKDDGTVEKMDTSVVDGKVVFEATGFSPYMVVYEPKAETAETPATGTPATGDMNAIAIYAWLAFMAIAAIAGLVYSDNKKKRV